MFTGLRIGELWSLRREEGMDVVTLSRLLGHASPSITLDKYGHALSDHQRASVEKLDGLYQPGPLSAPRVQPEQEQTPGPPKMQLG